MSDINTLVQACEMGDLDSVKALVEGHDKDTLIGWLSKEGKNSNGTSRTPLEIATEKDVIDYLFGILLRDSNDVDTLTNAYKKSLPKGTPLVCACEKGRLEDVRVLVEGHDVEKTGMSVEEMVSKEGKDSSGNSTRPIDAAATLIDTSEYEINKNKLKIIIYLANNGAKGVKLYGEPILFACTENNLKAVKAMIKAHDANNTKMTGNKKMSVEDMLKYKWVNKSTGDQWTLLQFAIKCTTTYDNLDIVKYLVETYPTVDLIGQMDDKQWNSLHYAAQYSDYNVKLLELLINSYTKTYEKDITNIINQETDEEKTPLDYALFNDVLYTTDDFKEQFVALLRKHGGKAKQYIQKLLSGKDKGTALVKLCIYDELIDVKILVEDGKCGADDWFETEGKDDEYGESLTPLQAAVKYQHLKIVKYLVDTFPNVYPNPIGKTNTNNNSSLHFAAECSENNVQTLQFLIDNYNGKDIKNIINEKDKDGYTPLDFAYKYNKSSIKNDIIKLLRQFGGKANYYDEYGVEVGKGKGDLNWSEIVVACQKGPLDSVQNLVKGHNVEKTGMSLEVWLSEKGMDSVGDQLTPLQAAVSGKKQEIVEYLLNICPNLISEKIEGKNILQLAVMSKNIVTLKFLLDKTTGNQTIENMIKNMINEKYHKQTPLDIAYQLLKNPDIKNEESKTKTINEIVNLLINHGATANIYDENGNLKGKGYLYDNIKIKF